MDVVRRNIWYIVSLEIWSFRKSCRYCDVITHQSI